MGIFYKKHIIGSREVTEITLENKNKMRVSFLDLGGIITEISVPDSEGNFKNVVLAHENYDDYEENKGYLGALIGRTSGRIKEAEFTLSGKKYALSKNYGKNSGHGGFEGFHRQLFNYKVIPNETAVTLHRLSNHMEEGYPGNVKIDVTYSLNDKNEFSIEYMALSDQDTLVNLTNHSYFNLSGDFNESILYHELYLDSEEFAELLEDSSVSGKLIRVENTPFDFRYHHEIGEEMNFNHSQIAIGNGYDHPFILNKGDGPKIRLIHRFTGRVMEMKTDHQGVVIYTQNYADQQVINGSLVLEPNKSIAIETQSLPIGLNEVNKEYSFLKSGQLYRKKTSYRFFTEIPDYNNMF